MDGSQGQPLQKDDEKSEKLYIHRRILTNIIPITTSTYVQEPFLAMNLFSITMSMYRLESSIK